LAARLPAGLCADRSFELNRADRAAAVRFSRPAPFEGDPVAVFIDKFRYRSLSLKSYNKRALHDGETDGLAKRAVFSILREFSFTQFWGEASAKFAAGREERNGEAMKKGILLCLLLGALAAQAQNTGRLTGTVLDQSGGTVPGAKVVIVNLGTNAQFTAETNAEGAFAVSQLDSGTYSVRVTASGFRTAEVKGVKVDVGKEYSLPPVRLELGEVQETVTVTAGVNLVQTTNAETAGTLYTEQIKYLPLPDRNPLDLISLQAGAGTNGITTTVIDGTRTSFSNMTIDGINVQDNFIRTNDLDYTPALPFLSQVSEMTIVTQNSNASMGNGSSQVVLVTPSGTNAFHGEVFWQNRTNATAANDFFNNANGVERPFLLLNQGGGNFGGPIRRNKLFFYSYYETYRLKQQNPAAATVLQPDARNGIFTYRDSNRNIRQIDILRAANVQFDPQVRSILQRVPTTANFSGVGDGLNTGGYLFNQRDNRTRDNTGVRMDYILSDRHTFSGTFAWNRDLVDRPDADLTFNKVPAVVNDNTSKLLSVGWRSTLSPSLTNELRGGFHLAPGDFNTSEDFSKPFLVDNFIFTNPVDTFRRQGRNTNTFDLLDNASWQRGTHVMRFGWQSQWIRVKYFDEGGTIPTYLIGISTANTRGLQTNQFPGGISASQLATANALLASLAGFVSDASQVFNVTSKTSGYVPGAPITRRLSLNGLSFYGTDQWRIRRNLTWNYGLRWEYMGRYDESNGLSLAPVIQNNNIVQTLLSNAKLDFAGAKNGRPLYNKDLNNFAPNVGLAWDPWGDGKTAVRLGYSINYVNDEALQAPDNAVTANAGLSTGAAITNLTQTISGGLPALRTPIFQVPRTFLDQLADDPGAGGFAIDSHLVTPYVQQWNVSLQRELPKKMSLEVRYVGNKGTKLYRGFDYNQVDIRSNGFLDDFLRARSNGFLSLDRTGTFNPAFNAAIPGSQRLTVFPNLDFGGVLTNSTVRTLIQEGQAGQLAAIYFLNDLAGTVPLVPNPNIFVADLLANRSNSTYHALQVELNRRVAAGLFLNANYTWSKVLTDSPGTNQVRFDAYLDTASPKLERARADYDIPQAFKANFIYELPFGGTHHFTSSKRAFNKLLSGWIVSSIFQLQSGPPFSIVSGRGTLNRSGRSGNNTANTPLNAGQIKNLLGVKRQGDTIYFIDPGVIGGDGRAVGADGDVPFKGQVFFNPDPGKLGVLERRMFNSPAYFDWDFSVTKQTTIRENKKLELRVELFNLPNNVIFFVPDQNINSADFGKITGTLNSPRFVQTVLRFIF
jgi:carboxypeptidase family protein